MKSFLFEDTFDSYAFNSLKVDKATQSRIRDFYKDLQEAGVEEEVKDAYIRFFRLKIDAKDKHDLYTSEALWEFKYDKKFENRRQIAETLAQLIYYVHDLRFSSTLKKIPPYLIMADRNEFLLTETKEWENYFNAPDETYDWTFAASTPDMALVKDLELDQKLNTIRHFNLFRPAEMCTVISLMGNIYDAQQTLNLQVKKAITERNFEAIFDNWNEKFGDDVRNGLKPSEYFLCDIQPSRNKIDENSKRVLFKIDDNTWREKKLNLNKYKQFWEIFERTSNERTIHGILSKIDRLTNEDLRRREGEFYTPVRYAQLAHQYIAQTLGDPEWWMRDDYRIWDMAAGTGNLEYDLPAASYPHTYLSTLHEGDVRILKKVFPAATTFQYDYLNDDAEALYHQQAYGASKLPEDLRADLANPNLTWIVFINPPFATANDKSKDSNNKSDVSFTLTQQVMSGRNWNLGETSRELFAQFLFRIHHEFQGKRAFLCMFSKLKYINAPNDEHLRDKVFQYEFQRGFMFPASTFQGPKGRLANFPIGFLIWNLSKHKDLRQQHIVLDVYNAKQRPEKIDEKPIPSVMRKNFLSKWVERPKTAQVFPPFSSGLNINGDKTDVRDRVAKGFLCSLCSNGNDVQHNNYVALYSGPYGSAGAWSVVPSNFVASMIVFAVRKSTPSMWWNDRDQYFQPTHLLPSTVENSLLQLDTPVLPEEFINDCVVFALFHPANQTVSLIDVNYQGKTYQIRNNLFPFLRKEVEKWHCSEPGIMAGMLTDDDRFAAQWLAGKPLSKEAQAVMESGRRMYACFYENAAMLNTNKYRVSTWDVGLYQIDRCLKDENYNAETSYSEFYTPLNEAVKQLGKKIYAQLRDFGFIC